MRDSMLWCEGVGIRWNDNYSGEVMVEAPRADHVWFAKESKDIPVGYLTMEIEATTRDEFSDEVYNIIFYHVSMGNEVKRKVIDKVNDWIPVRDHQHRWHLPTVVAEYGAHNYRDYEGLLPDDARERIIELVLTHTHTFQEHVDCTLLRIIRDIMANLLMEQMEYDEEHELDDPHWERATALLADAVYNITTVCEWTISGVDWELELQKKKNTTNR